MFMSCETMWLDPSYETMWFISLDPSCDVMRYLLSIYSSSHVLSKGMFSKSSIHICATMLGCKIEGEVCFYTSRGSLVSILQISYAYY